MKRYRVVLCALATVAAVAALGAVCYWAYRQLLILALALVFLALATLTI